MTRSDGAMENKPYVAMTPEEFSLETRFVILNFMGLVPTSNLGERVPLGASWQSSSSGSHKSVSLHSRSSSSSSQVLPEFTDEQILQRVSAHGTDTELKKPLAKSRSLPKEESLPEVYALPRQQGGTRPTKAMLMKQLRKTKSAVEPSAVGATGKWGGVGHGLQRGERVEEEFEPLETDAGTSGVADLATAGLSTAEDNTISGIRIPSATPTNGDKLFEITQGLSLSNISSLDISDQETGYSDVATPVISRIHTNGGLHPTSALTTDSLTTKHEEIGIDEADSAEVAVMLGIPPNENASAFRFRGRSESPCRPTTLDLSEDAPKSPGAPSWKELVRSPVNEPADSGSDNTGDVDQVDLFRSHSGVQPGGSSAPDGVGETPQDGNEDGVETGSSSVSAHGETEAGSSQTRPGPNRQHSQLSSVSSNSLPSPVSALDESGRSWVSSRTSLSDLNMVDVAALINNHVLPPVALPLREELGEQWRELENIYEHAVQNEEVRDILSPVPSSCSPESEVARRLAVIGDQVQEEYGEAIEQAISGVLGLPRERLTYEVFITALLSAGLRRAQIEGWKQVALVMLFSQRLALGLLQRGERHLRDLVDLTARAINDRAAGFIIDQGGWHSLSELELDSPVSVSDISTQLLPETDVRQGYPLTDIAETDTGPSQDTPDSQHLPLLPGLHPSSPPGAASASPVSPFTHTPASDNTVMSASPSDENSNKPLKRVDKDETTPPAPAPQPAAGNHHGGGANGQLTPEEIKSIEEAVTSVRQEIQLIRQVSADLSMDINHRQHDSPGGDRSDTNWHQVAALALLATLGVAIVVVARYRRGL